MHLTAEVEHPFSGPTGWFEAKGDEILLDEPLLAALPEKPRELVRSLDARGTVNFDLRTWRAAGRRAGPPASPAGLERLLGPLQQVPLSAEQRPRRAGDDRRRLDAAGPRREQQHRRGSPATEPERPRRCEQGNELVLETCR